MFGMGDPLPRTTVFNLYYLDLRPCKNPLVHMEGTATLVISYLGPSVSPIRLSTYQCLFALLPNVISPKKGPQSLLLQCWLIHGRHDMRLSMLRTHRRPTTSIRAPNMLGIPSPIARDMHVPQSIAHFFAF